MGTAATLSKRKFPLASALVCLTILKSPGPCSSETITIPATGAPLGSSTFPVIVAFDGAGVGVGLGVGTGVGDGVVPGVGVGVGLEFELTEGHPVARERMEVK